MLNKVSAAALSLFLGAGALAQASAIRYEITDLAPGPVATALAINSDGHVVGYYLPTGHSADGSHGFLYKDGVVTDIPPFAGGLNCQATGINDSDIVVGWAENSTFTKAFTFINGGPDPVQRGTLGGNNSYACAINNSGIVTGYSQIAGNTAYHAFLYSLANATISNTDDAGTLGTGTNSSANAINSLGVAAGSSQLTGDLKTHAATFFPGGRVDLGTLDTGDNSVAFGINDADIVVGYSQISGNSGQHAFSYDQNGNFTDLGLLPGTDSSQANAINTEGTIVGYCSILLGGATRAFVYSNGVMSDLNKMIAPGSGKIIAEANAINDSGQIVGRALNTALNESYAVLLTPQVIDAPTLAVAGKPRIKTKKKKLTISGSAVSDVTSVTWQLGAKAKQTASGTVSWSFRTPKLKHGKNVFTIIAHGYGGDSVPGTVVIIKR